MTVRAARRALTVRGARPAGTTTPANGRRGAGLAYCREDLPHEIGNSAETGAWLPKPPAT